MKKVKKYPIIGGPLNGQFANQKDWWKAYTSPNQYFGGRYDREAGQFVGFEPEYVRFNSGERGSPVSCVWLHVSMLPEAVRLPQ